MADTPPIIDITGADARKAEAARKRAETRRKNAEAKQRQAKAATSEPTREAVESLHGLVAMGVAGLWMALSPLYPGMKAAEPTEQELDAILIPLERIYLRHAAVPTVNPDIRDAFQCATALGAYGTRVYLGWSQSYKRPRRQGGIPPQPPGRASGPGQNGGGTVNVAGQQYAAGTPDAVMAELWKETAAAEAARHATGDAGPTDVGT